MNLVVTGATSFLGAALVRRLLEMHHHVYAVVRPGSANRKALPESAEGLRVIELELEKLDQIATVVQEPCECFFHFGWDGSGSANREKRDVQQKNVTDSMKALEGARSLGCRRFLFSGSQAEYGQCREVMKEEQECRPVSEYGKAKVDFYRQATEMCEAWRKSGLAWMEYVHVRIFSVYGPGDHPWSLVNTCLDTFLAGGHMQLGACTQFWNFLYIEDLVEGLTALMFQPGELSGSRIYNLAGDASQTRPLREYVEEMYRFCGEQGDFAYGKLPPNAEGPANLIPDISRVQQLTGWGPKVSLEEGIGRMLAVKRG